MIRLVYAALFYSTNHTTTDKIDRLPYELLYHIRQFIDEPLDLLQMSYVCRRWQSLVMNDEYFLNHLFSRSLERSKKGWQFGDAFYNWNRKAQRPFNIDESLFPINLRSSECDFLPWTNSGHSCDYKARYEHGYALSLFESSHSFSFWVFLPHQFELNIQLGNCHVDGVNIVICADSEYHFNNENHVSIADRWIHIVLTKTNSQRSYRVWIDGKYISKLIQYYLYFSEQEGFNSHINLLLFSKLDNNTLEESSKPRIADLNAFKRCLTCVEIRAIHQQQISIKQVKVGSYLQQ